MASRSASSCRGGGCRGSARTAGPSRRRPRRCGSGSGGGAAPSATGSGATARPEKGGRTRPTVGPGVWIGGVGAVRDRIARTAWIPIRGGAQMKGQASGRECPDFIRRRRRAVRRHRRVHRTRDRPLGPRRGSDPGAPPMTRAAGHPILPPGTFSARQTTAHRPPAITPLPASPRRPSAGSPPR